MKSIPEESALDEDEEDTSNDVIYTGGVKAMETNVAGYRSGVKDSVKIVGQQAKVT
jgi:uncharacterized protein related to proFAR isomerase